MGLEKTAKVTLNVLHLFKIKISTYKTTCIMVRMLAYKKISTYINKNVSGKNELF